MRFVPLAIQMLLLAAPLFAADPLAALVGDAKAATLRSTGTVLARMPSNGSLSLAPAMSSRAALQAETASGPIAAGIEYLRLLPLPAGKTAGDDAWLALFNDMHAVSTMEGITYFSVTRGKEKPLFSQSFCVVSPADTRRVPDPVFAQVPREDVLYTLQEDSSFGRNVYRESFAFPGDHLGAKVENVTTISFLFVPLIQPGGFVSHVVLIPVGDRLLFYGASWVRTSMPIGDRGAREDSLKNRVAAMSRWLESRIVAGQ